MQLQQQKAPHFYTKCGRAVENAGIFSQDAISSAGEAQAQPMFLFVKNPRSIGWLPKFWWGGSTCQW
jgi:hypothetical protein